MKWFRIATEGQTTDGRKIQRAWLEQIAETYNRATYGARIWLEHMRGMLPDGPFDALGDVLAVRTMEEGGKLALYAQLEPTERLRAYNAKRQKLYTSIEINPDFAGTGRAYLMGLAVTDSPASLGTDMLAFCAGAGAANPLNSRKVHPENVLSTAEETDLAGLFTDAGDGDGEGEADPPADKAPTLLAKIRALFASHKAADATEAAAFRADLEATLGTIAGEVAAARAFASAEADAKARAAVADLSAELAALKATVAKHAADLAALDAEPAGKPRAPALGAAGGEHLSGF